VATFGYTIDHWEVCGSTMFLDSSALNRGADGLR
jgi:hypothetical protein